MVNVWFCCVEKSGMNNILVCFIQEKEMWMCRENDNTTFLITQAVNMFLAERYKLKGQFT